MKRNTIITIIVIALLATLAIVKLVNNKKTVKENNQIIDRSHIPVSVNTAFAKIQDLNIAIVRPAIAKPNDMASIASTMPGKIEELNIELGTRVSKGQIIGKIDTKSIDIQIQNLELAVDKMERDYLRNKDLYEGNALSESNYLDAKFGYESRALELQEAKQNVSDSYIKAPLSGIITSKNNVAGEFIGAGTPIATMVDVSTIKIDVNVNEEEVRFIEIDQKVNITSKIYPDSVFVGKVNYLSPNADENHNFTIEIAVNASENPSLRAGSYVNVHFNSDAEFEALQIPKRALAEGIKNAYVYIVDGDRAKRKEIKVGRENGSYIEVISGLNDGDEVVVDGQINIVDNSLIESKDNN